MSFYGISLSPTAQAYLSTSLSSPLSTLAGVGAAATLSGYLVGKITQLATGILVLALSCASCCMCTLPAIVISIPASVGMCAYITFVALPQLAPVSAQVQTTFFIGALISHIA
jgi:hypothetical protein